MKVKGMVFLLLALCLSLSLLSPAALGTHRSSPENWATPPMTTNSGIGDLALTGLSVF